MGRSAAAPARTSRTCGSLTQTAGNFCQPVRIERIVGSEFLDYAALLAEEKRPMQAEVVGLRRIDQVARIRRAHLEEQAVVEFAQDGTFECALQIRERVAPGQHVNADGRAFAQEVSQL